MKKLIVTAMLGSVLYMGCNNSGAADLDVRTFQLEYIEPAAANRIIDPYVFADRGGMISIEQETGLITVRETAEMLSRIEEVLRKYDQPEPSVRLHFRIIQANGGGQTDPELAEIAEALPKNVFRFKNYSLVAEAVLTGIEYSGISQRVGSDYMIEGSIGEVRDAEDGGTVQLQIGLNTVDFGPAFETAVNARVGQLLILGTAQPDPQGGALILAVRAELERP
jgi:hypothetical protein